MSSLFSSFLLPLISGYLLQLSIPRLKYQLLRLTGYIIFLRSLLLGTLLYFVGYHLVNIAKYLLLQLNHQPTNTLFSQLWGLTKSPWQVLSETNGSHPAPDGAIMALVLALSISLLSGLFGHIFPLQQRKWQRNALLAEGGSAEKLLDIAMNGEGENKQGIPIKIVLKSKTFYLGFVEELPVNNHSPRPDIKIFPFARGIIIEGNPGLKVTRSYRPEINAIKEYQEKINDNKEAGGLLVEGKVIPARTIQTIAENFGVTIFWDEIESISLWTNIRPLSKNQPAGKPTNSPPAQPASF